MYDSCNGKHAKVEISKIISKVAEIGPMCYFLGDNHTIFLP